MENPPPVKVMFHAVFKRGGVGASGDDGGTSSQHVVALLEDKYIVEIKVEPHDSHDFFMTKTMNTFGERKRRQVVAKDYR
jgi:hypothetical protein